MSKLDEEQRAEVAAAIKEVRIAAKEARLINLELHAVLMEAVAALAAISTSGGAV